MRLTDERTAVVTEDETPIDECDAEALCEVLEQEYEQLTFESGGSHRLYVHGTYELPRSLTRLLYRADFMLLDVYSDSPKDGCDLNAAFDKCGTFHAELNIYQES